MKYLIAALAIALMALLLALWRLDHVSTQLDASDTALEQIRAAVQRRLTQEAGRDEIDRKHTKELNDAKQKNDVLATDVDAGNQRLLVSAKCPVPAAAGAASVDDGAAVELAANARSDYHALREQISRDEIKLAALQAYVTTVCIGKDSDQ